MGYQDDYVYGAEFPHRRLYGRVARAELIGTGHYARHSYEFDAVDVEMTSDGDFTALFHPEEKHHFALLRIVTTERQFRLMSGVAPQPGLWFALEIAPTGPGPIAFHAQLVATGYNALSRGTLQSATFLFDDGTLGGGPDRGPDGGPDLGDGGVGYVNIAQRWAARKDVIVREPGSFEFAESGLARTKVAEQDTSDKAKRALRSLSAAATTDVAAAQALAEQCGFPRRALVDGRTIGNMLAAIPTPHHVTIHDVGQASFSSLCDPAGRPLIYFDVGWPVAFNGKTAPKVFSPPPTNTNAPVVISHWDYDHLSGFYRFPAFQQALWVAPVQHLGPGGKKIAATLARQTLLLGWEGLQISWTWGDLHKCSGLPTIVNHSGLALAATLSSGRSALLVGDANYDSIVLPNNSSFDFLAVTHHGALFAGAVPKPSTPTSRAVISFGRGNVYKHPKKAAVSFHTAAQWRLEQTAGTRRQRRGDRVLGP